MNYQNGDYGLMTQISEENNEIINESPNAKLYFHNTLICDKSWSQSGPVMWDAVNKEFYIGSTVLQENKKNKLNSSKTRATKPKIKKISQK